MTHYIQKMSGYLSEARGYGCNGYELAVTIQFDAKEFNRIKKKQDPLDAAMPQIKNVVLDACGVRGIPSYAPLSMRQRYPRARHGLITLTVYFDVSEYTAKLLGIETKAILGWYTSSVSVDLQSTLEATRNDGHMFAKTALASHFGN